MSECLHSVYICEISQLHSCGTILLLRTSHGEFLSFRLRGPERVKDIADKLSESMGKLGGGLKEIVPESKSLRELSEAFVKRKDGVRRYYSQDCKRVGWDGRER
jgi:hypothetical protein